MKGVELDSLGIELVNVQRAWDSMAKRDPNDKWGIVDIDSMPYFDNPHIFNEAGEVTEALEDLAAKAAKDGGETPNIDIIREKIGAHLLYLRVTGGEEVGFDEQMLGTLGVSLEPISEDIIDRHRDALSAQLADAPTGRPLRYDQGQREDIKQELIVRDPKLIRAEFAAGRDWAFQFILERSGLVPPTIYPELVSEDEVWSGYLSTDDARNFFYKANIHPRHEYTLGRIWANSPHELTHITEFTNLREAIMRGEVSAAMGVTTLHSAEVVQAEFNSQAMEQMALRELGSGQAQGIRSEVAWRHRFEADYIFYAEMVWTNAHIMINSGSDFDEAVKYVEDRLLLDTHENISKSVSARHEDPVIRGYFGAYWPGLAVAMDMIKPGHMLDPTGETPDPGTFSEAQREVLGTTMSQPVRLKDIREKIAGLVMPN